MIKTGCDKTARDVVIYFGEYKQGRKMMGNYRVDDCIYSEFVWEKMY